MLTTGADLRSQLPGLGLVAFIGDGSVLPRESGISDMPFKGDNVQLFKSPESLKVTITLPNRGKVEGMGLRQGVTLIVGGGYHGKTTLLEALQVIGPFFVSLSSFLLDGDLQQGARRRQGVCGNITERCESPC